MTISAPRRIGRAAYGVARGRSRRHWFDLWPGLDFERDSDGRWAKVIYRGREATVLVPSSHLTERRVESIVVVGAGPSLHGQHLERLRERACLLTNGSLSLIESHQVVPMAVFIEDEGFVADTQDLVVAIPDGTHCFFTPAVLRAICEIDPAHLGRWRVSLAEILHKPIQAKRPNPEELAARPFVVSGGGEVFFSTDCDSGFGSCGTVVFCALQLAVQCAPDGIGLAGVDMSHFEKPRIHEGATRQAPSHLERRLSSILRGMRLTAEICAERGIATENYSSLSIIPPGEFPYDEWLDSDRRKPAAGA